MQPEELGEAIATRRKALGLTQDQLAMTAGVNRRVIGELERGKPTIQLAIALRTLEAVGIAVHLEPR